MKRWVVDWKNDGSYDYSIEHRECKSCNGGAIFLSQPIIDHPENEGNQEYSASDNWTHTHFETEAEAMAHVEAVLMNLAEYHAATTITILRKLK